MSLTDMPVGFQSFLFLFLLLALQNLPLSSALGIEFIKPAPGGTYPAGNFTAQWQDAGGQQSTMSSLTTYVLDLMVGGVTDYDSGVVQLLSTGLVADGSAAATIQRNAAQTIQNGFYLRMTSNTSSGNTVVNYSYRFSLVEMTGVTDERYIQGAAQNPATSQVPTAQYNVIQTPTTNITQPPRNVTTTIIPPVDEETQSTNRMSTWAIVGMTVSVTIAGTALIAAAAWFLRRRRRRTSKNNNNKEPPSQPPTRKSLHASFFGGKPELAAHTPSSSVSRSLAEMDIDKDPEELEGVVIVHELEGNWTAYEMPLRHSRQPAYDPTR